MKLIVGRYVNIIENNFQKIQVCFKKGPLKKYVNQEGGRKVTKSDLRRTECDQKGDATH